MAGIYITSKVSNEFPCNIFSPSQFPSNPEDILYAFMFLQNTLQTQDICSAKVVPQLGFFFHLGFLVFFLFLS